MSVKLKCFFVIIAAVCIFGFGFATAENNDSGHPDTNVMYFYLKPCHACEYTNQFLDGLEEKMGIKYPGFRISRYDVADIKSFNLLEKLIKKYNIPSEDNVLPIAFIGQKYLSGESDIKNGMEQEIIDFYSNPKENMRYGSQEDFQRSIADLNCINALLAGFVNGLNPCSISMLLFLLSIVTIESKNVIKISSSYIAGKFLCYLLMGTLFFKLVGLIDVSLIGKIIKMLVLPLILLLIGLNIHDYFAARKEKYNRIVLQLPAVLRKYNHNLIKTVSSRNNLRYVILISFFIGIFVSAGEFFCTGQIYLISIVTVLNSGSGLNGKAFIALLVYNTAFILPLITVALVIYKGKALFDVSEMFREKLPAIKIVNAIIYLIIAFIVIFAW